MNADAHGGDRHAMSRAAGRDACSLLDFSVNVRPEGMPGFLRAALRRSETALETYPSPHAEEACEAAARRYGLPASHFVFGNGSNELIHALARALVRRGMTVACVVEPAFSEYALACERAGMRIMRLLDQEALPLAGANALATLDEGLAAVPQGSPIFLANPGNPSGLFRSPELLRRLLSRRPDLLWVLDEAFVEYAGPEAEVSLLADLPEQTVVLRSLTKFHALPGLRLGFLAASRTQAAAVQAELPVWNVNGLALAAAVAVLDDTSNFAESTRATNAERRTHLEATLAALPGVEVFSSAANYVLFRCARAPADLNTRLLRHYGMAVRDCSNYNGMENGGWFRAAVRFPQEHERLAAALADILGESQDRTAPSRPATPPRVPALMLQGTSSNVGKSVLAAAFCRIFRQDGYDVAPFKAQNISLNSGVTAAGEEMALAQIVQARAARLEPEVRMNPILIKPQSGAASHLVLLGQAVGQGEAHGYYRTDILWQHVARAYDGLSAEHEIMVLEGAGSPAEINLKQHDLVNMRMARHADASVLLVGDIDRGGVYASFLGTWLTFSAEERRLLLGYLVNCFQGEAGQLAPAHTYLREHTGVPVLGVIPRIHDINLPEEDMARFCWKNTRTAGSVMPNVPDIAEQDNQSGVHDLEKALDRLADVVREHVDLPSIYRNMGLR